MNTKVRQHAIPGSDTWIVRCGEAKLMAALRLFCCPPAGGGPFDFRDWPVNCPGDVELFSIQLPGRGAGIRIPMAAK
jgi:medium-chain acyl-[acyl-carrier-protein] hydrolase